MIKGIYLMEEPYMEKMSDEEVLSDLDFLYKDSNASSTLDSGDYKIKKSTYRGETFCFVIYESEYDPSLRAMLISYQIIQKANPSFVKVFKYGENRVVVAYPNFSEDGIEIAKTYEIMMDELLRVTVFFLHNFGPEEAVDMLRDYINTNVSYPSNRIGVVNN